MNDVDLSKTIREALASCPIWDFHTHLYPPSFGTPLGRGVEHDPYGLMLWGIDELITYHYLVAEYFRTSGKAGPDYERFWALSKTEQTDVIWQELFVNRAPLSEACRGVITTLSRLGLDPNEKDLEKHRLWFSEQTPDEYIDKVLEISGVERVTMTNDVFDDNERERWLGSPDLSSDPRFPTVLRFDALVTDWPQAATALNQWGYSVDEGFSDSATSEVRRFLVDWIERMQPLYCAMSLPPSWRYVSPGSTSSSELPGQRSLTDAILPVCEQYDLPLALMIGVNRGTNPALRVAGDSVGNADVESLALLCRDYPQQRFFCTMLARENQHELAVTARKFPNLTPFGCWWFLNNPSLIDEITRMRMELLGTSFIPQHSDARVLDQLIYKWEHSRLVIASVLEDKFRDLQAVGLSVTQAMIEQEVKTLMHDNVASLLVKK